jgi:hypothetical protein
MIRLAMSNEKATTAPTANLSRLSVTFAQGLRDQVLPTGANGRGEADVLIRDEFVEHDREADPADAAPAGHDADRERAAFLKPMALDAELRCDEQVISSGPGLQKRRKLEPLAEGTNTRPTPRPPKIP